ncbi:hypothetical protein ACOY6A_21745, partial [Enterobacter roggenkampii]|uniref:hypothetical protein n=1 Tax=Enterobacter roggenkampii TaxID=1812935 RepID=UPI001C9400CB
ADRNRSHWRTSKTPSYTKSVSWHHYHNFLSNIYKTTTLSFPRPIRLNQPIQAKFPDAAAKN